MEQQNPGAYIGHINSNMNFSGNKSIKILIGCFLILINIFLYILFHGTKDLFIVEQINSVFNIIPVFDGITIQNKFLTGYVIDIIWIVAFNLIVSTFNNSIYQWFVLFVAISTEFLQLINNSLGTFDVVDLVIYVCITAIFIIYRKIKNKRCICIQP